MILRKKKIPIKSVKEIFNKSKSLSTISIVSSLAICMIGVAVVPMIKSQYPLVARGYNLAVDKNVERAQLKLSVDSHKALQIVTEKPSIVPGESAAQKEAREKAEAEARAKAEAAAAAAKRNVVSRERRVYVDPSNFDAVYAAAEARFGVDARILRAIHYVETGCSGSTEKSNPSGATGPMQFLPSTFARHGVDGNGDGIKDVHNLEDAVFSAAAYLKACGYPNLKQALFGYNPSMSYYNKVMKVAQSLGYQQ